MIFTKQEIKQYKQQLRKQYSQELREYERTVKMTSEELLILREWTSSGNSLHSNPYGFNHGGYAGEMDFIDAFRLATEPAECFVALCFDEYEDTSFVF